MSTQNESPRPKSPHDTNDHDAKEQGEKGHDDNGHQTFEFTYDDTGMTASVRAPNGWTMERVVEEAYRELGESVHLEDRVEVGGAVLSAGQRALKVKDYFATGSGTAFHIVSRPGGAVHRATGSERPGA